jgi:phosphoglycerate dehydrogenase-like enzyme
MLEAPSLRWVHTHSAGADRAISAVAAARRDGHHVVGANAGVVAQTALAGVLALARHLPQLIDAQRARWAPLIGSGLPRDLQGQRATIVGWGPIGQQVGCAARAGAVGDGGQAARHAGW